MYLGLRVEGLGFRVEVQGFRPLLSPGISGPLLQRKGPARPVASQKQEPKDHIRRAEP